MDIGPYKKTSNPREVCNYCDFCNSHNVYMRKSVEVLSADCKHPNVAKFAPNFGRFFSTHLDHDDCDVFTPDWCPVKNKAKE